MEKEPPTEFVCPISLQVMKDPVIAEDGYTYERKFLMEWLSKSSVSPMTREHMNPKHVLPNTEIFRRILRSEFAPEIIIDLTED